MSIKRLVMESSAALAGRTTRMLAVSLLLLTGAPAVAADYYVDCGSGGFDGNSGTSMSTPWKTLKHAAATVPSGVAATIHVKGGVCGEKEVDLSPSGPGGHCRGNEAHCIVWKGESPCFVGESGCVGGGANRTVIRSSATDEGSFGVKITGSHVRFENFRFEPPGSTNMKKYTSAMWVNGRNTVIEDVLLTNIQVMTGAAEQGVNITEASDVVVSGGSVTGLEKSGYLTVGAPGKLATRVVFKDTVSHGNNNGYVLDGHSEVIMYDGAKASANQQHGFWLGFGVLPSTAEITLLGVEASGTVNGNGIYSQRGPLYVENSFLHSNGSAGIDIVETGGDPGINTRVVIVGSTIRDNLQESIAGWGQVRVNRRRVHVTLADSIVARTTPTSTGQDQRGRALLYTKRQDSLLQWSHSVLSRVEDDKPLVTVVGTDNVQRHCIIAGGGMARCDAVGDCDHDGSVQPGELEFGRDIGLGLASLAVCPQFDRNGDGTVTVEERVAAVSIAAGAPANTNVITSSPVFVSGRRLAVGSPGRDVGVMPADVADLLDVDVCRLDVCDHDDQVRIVGSGFDMGAFEGDTGQPGTGCTTLDPGQCFAPGPPLPTITVKARNRTICPTGGTTVVFDVSGIPGSMVSGLQIDLSYDSAKLSLSACGSGVPTNPNLTVDFVGPPPTPTPGAGPTPTPGTVHGRAMFGDFNPAHHPRDTFGNTNGAFHCTFNYVAAPLSGTTSIGVSNVVVSTAEGNRLPAVGANGTLTVTSCCSGCC